MATANHVFYEDGTVQLKAVLTNPDTGAAVEPTTVRFIVRKPDGTETTYSAPTHTPGTSIYTQNVTPADGEAGVWRWRIETLTPAAVALDSFVVKDKTLA